MLHGYYTTTLLILSGEAGAIVKRHFVKFALTFEKKKKKGLSNFFVTLKVFGILDDCLL